MKIDEFCVEYGQEPRSIDLVCQDWTVSAVDGLLARLDHDCVGEFVVIGDALHGDGIRDQIPRELKDAFLGLMKDKANTYAEMRQILKEKICDSNGGHLSFNDPHVRGFVSKLKGQIGENQFQRHVGTAARLASSGSQEGWDIVISQADGTNDYIQVKTYTNAKDVVSKMLALHEKLALGAIEGVDGDVVEHIDFAIPANIVDEVKQRISDQYPELANIKLHTIPLSAKVAAGYVEEGLNNVGPEQLEHLFGELLCGTLAAGSLHAVVNAFLWYKGAKDASTAF